MIRKILVCVAIVVASVLLVDTSPKAASTPVQQHQDITTREYWIERGYEVIHDWWCAGTNTMVQLYKDQEVITINYEEHEVWSCYGGYAGCFVDYLEEAKVLHTEE
jgi:hypothetical protein